MKVRCTLELNSWGKGLFSPYPMSSLNHPMGLFSCVPVKLLVQIQAAHVRLLGSRARVRMWPAPLCPIPLPPGINLPPITPPPKNVPSMPLFHPPTTLSHPLSWPAPAGANVPNSGLDLAFGSQCRLLCQPKQPSNQHKQKQKCLFGLFCPSIISPNDLSVALVAMGWGGALGHIEARRNCQGEEGQNSDQNHGECTLSLSQRGPQMGLLIIAPD